MRRTIFAEATSLEDLQREVNALEAEGHAFLGLSVGVAPGARLYVAVLAAIDEQDEQEAEDQGTGPVDEEEEQERGGSAGIA